MRTSIFTDSPEGVRTTWVWAVPILLVVFFFVGQIIAVVPAVESGMIHEDEIEAYPNILYMLTVIFGSVLLILGLWVRFFERKSLASIGMVLEPKGKAKLGWGYGIGLLMATSSVVGIWALGGYKIEGPQDFTLVSYVPIFLLALGFLVQSSVEEIMFRGWMLSRMSERFGLWAGVLSNATLFTLMHVEFSGEEAFSLIDFSIFTIMTMLFSIFLSFLAIRQKSVWGACAWHAAWNWSFITWFGLPTTGIALDITPLWVDLVMVEGQANWLTGGAVGPENSAITMVVLLIGCVLLYRSVRKTMTA